VINCITGTLSFPLWNEQQNTYPGCVSYRTLSFLGLPLSYTQGSDTAVHWYSLSTELNPNWSTYYATQPEILAYWEDLFKKHNLEKFTTLNTAVISLEWDEDQQYYHIVLEDTITGKRQETTAEIVISAVGIFRDPTIPSDLTGTEKFRGLSWHSARWRHDINLSGKRVGVIGNGCSA
jgi:cation diffusion facilitator CzcD-associated flavoprotein CzcO